MEALVSKPLIINFKLSKDVYMYISILTENKVVLMPYSIVYDAQAQNRKLPPSSLALLPGIIWNALKRWRSK